MPKISHEALFEKAIQAGIDRDYPFAIETLTRIVSETDDYPEAFLYLGRSYYALGDYHRSVGAFRLFLETGTDDETAWFFLSRSYLAMRRYAEAAVSCRRAIAAGSVSGKVDRAASYALLGTAYLRLRKFAKAQEAFTQATSIDPDDKRIFIAYRNSLFIGAVRALAKGDPNMARQMLSFVISNGGDGIASRLYRSRAYRALEQLDDALEDATEAMRLAPDDLKIRLQRAVLLLSIGKTEIALSELAKVRRILPELPDIEWDASMLDQYRAFELLRAGDSKGALSVALDLLRRGVKEPRARMVAAEAYRQLGQYERAINHFTRAIEGDPSSPDLLLGRADSYRAVGDYAQALADVKRAQRIGADPELVKYYGTLCRANLGEDPQSLLSDLQSLVRAHPTDPKLVQALAESLYKIGRPDLSRGWFDKVLTLDPDNELSQLYLISIAESIDEDEAIVSTYERYLNGFPDNIKIRREYIQRLLNMRSWAKAATALEQAAPFEPVTRKTNRLLAYCYRHCRRWRDASILYRILLRGEPENEDYLLELAICLEHSNAQAMAIGLLEKGAAYIRKSRPYTALGKLLLSAGKTEKAIQALNRALEHDASDKAAVRALADLYAKKGPESLAKRWALEVKRVEKNKSAIS